jgi:hypothetical protein
MLRLIVAVDTLTPRSSSNASQCSSSVRSGFLQRWSGNHSLSIAALMAGGPGGVLAPTCPVSLRLFNQRLIEGSETPKILATSALGIPRSTASNTFTLRSSEYALMQTVLLRIKHHASRCDKRVEARETLMRLRPQALKALGALETIEQLRVLTDEERALQRAFEMLLAAARNAG